MLQESMVSSTTNNQENRTITTIIAQESMIPSKNNSQEIINSSSTISQVNSNETTFTATCRSETF